MIQLKRGTTDYWSNQNPVLSDGQAAVVRTVYDTMTNAYNARLKIGDGKTAYNDLEFAVPDIAIYMQIIISKYLLTEISRYALEEHKMDISIQLIIDCDFSGTSEDLLQLS